MGLASPLPLRRVSAVTQVGGRPGRMPYRILVVEDEADTREVLTILLGRDAHLVDTAESGPEASNYSHGAATT